MRHARGERRAIVEGVRLLAFGELQLAVEGVDGVPEGQDALLFLGKVDGHCDGMRGGAWNFGVACFA